MTRLKQELRFQGKSAYSLAQDLGVSFGTVYNWTQGRHLPRTQHMKQLAQLLGVSIEELFFSDDGGDHESRSD
jgi:transcriptional regulator with XRE-family HTH domain